MFCGRGSRLGAVAGPATGARGAEAGEEARAPSRVAVDLVLVEDDEGDALLVEALLEEVGDRRQLGWYRSLAEAKAALAARPQCVLLDLGLPDSDGDAAVRHVVRQAPDAAVVVLTGIDDEERGIRAMAAGAQDYLVKGSVDGRLLVRSIRYAIERKRTANTARRLREAELRAEENERLERGLLPRPLLRTSLLRCITLYRPGGEEALLGGDFFDVVELANGTVRAVIGDVAGHGPDEAALGVRLRVAWRTLVLAGAGIAATLAALQDVFVTERASPAVFVTLCDLVVDPANQLMRIARAGHHLPFVLGEDSCTRAARVGGPPLGVVDHAGWRVEEVRLPRRWSVLLYTDGLVENRMDEENGRVRLGDDGLARLLESSVAQRQDIAEIVDHRLARISVGRHSRLSDDVAIVALAAPDGD